MNKRESVLKVIQEKMSDKQFWKWVSSWFSIDLIIDIVKNWDDDIIEEEYNKFKKRGLIK